ncbi:MAG TPA: DUF983 domain-containing protein [Blastocatellia bacterium]|nr:DUF983 domain-containing protein [Blastocatellia bacterium]
MDTARARKILVRGLRLRCPDCGQASLYASLFKMRHHCSHCGLVFEREQGYFIGALYINVIVTESLLLFLFMLYYMVRPVSEDALYAVLFALALILPLVFFRHSRSLWLAVDHIIEPNAKRVEPGEGVDLGN